MRLLHTQVIVGSNPTITTKFWGRSINGDAVDCKSADLCHDWFDPSIPHHFLVLSYSGYYTRLSSEILGFDSPQDRQVLSL